LQTSLISGCASALHGLAFMLTWASDLHLMCTTGRAGRDGERADCVLMYRFADAVKQASMVSFEPGWESRLGDMMLYAAATSRCRRSMISRCEGFLLHVGYRRQGYALYTSACERKTEGLIQLAVTDHFRHVTSASAIWQCNSPQ
jgi:superfamily II DNA helicase RecQ